MIAAQCPMVIKFTIQNYNSMKTLKSLFLGLALVVVCTAAKATFRTDEGNLSKNFAINTYIDAMTRGKLAGFSEALDQNAKFTMLRGNQVLSFSKKEMLDNMKTNKNIELACTTSTQVVENNAEVSIVKVDMQFDGYVRSNYVTIANTGNGWKITNVYSVFK